VANGVPCVIGVRCAMHADHDILHGTDVRTT
jgi:hypothetical protein